MADAWDVAKDGLGFAGAVLAAVPWFRDFGGRRDLAVLRSIPGADAKGRAFLERIAVRTRHRHEAPRGSDLVLQLAGLMLLALSFAISALRGLFGLLG